MKLIHRKTLVAGLLFVTGAAAGYLAAPAVLESLFAEQKIHAMWKDRFGTLAQLRDGVDAVVVGDVLAREPGRVIGDPADPELEFTNLQLSVSRVLKGETGSQIVVEVTGDLLRSRVLFLGLPDFEVGGSYLLFLNRAENGRYYVVNNQGGYQVVRTENDESFLAAGDPEDEIGGHFHGMEIGEAIRQIEAAEHAGGDRDGREPRRLR